MGEISYTYSVRDLGATFGFDVGYKTQGACRDVSESRKSKAET